LADAEHNRQAVVADGWFKSAAVEQSELVSQTAEANAKASEIMERQARWWLLNWIHFGDCRTEYCCHRRDVCQRE
jgi:hypothetical protein